jgi:hypothetical protein
MIREFIAHHLGPAENDPVLDVLEIDQPAEDLQFIAPIHLVINLVDGRYGHRLILDADIDRLSCIALHQLIDRRRHRRGEEDGLPFRRRLAEDLFDVVAEPHVEHAIRLVEDDHADLVEFQRAAFEMVHDPARRADDDLGAFAQPAKLTVITLPAIDWQFAHAALEQRQLGDFLRDLHGQLARRAKNQHLGRTQVAVHPLDGRNGERGRLSRTRLRQSHHVLPLEQGRDGFRLNRRRFLKAHLGDGLQDLG